ERTYRLMLALMRGEFADAERLIRECQALLPPSAQGDQLAVQIFTLRREQGRLAGMQPLVSLFLRQNAAANVWRPGLTLLQLELGQRDEARVALDTLAANDFTSIPRDGRWLICIVYLSEVCAGLGDAARAAVLYRLLLPYSGRNIVLGVGLACCGSA